MKITVRTLDSQNHYFELKNEEITVKEFKEHIVSSVNIPVEKQRIIFQGKVLHDEKKLKEYNVDGCVVHLVQRAPPSSTGANRNTGERLSSHPTSSAPTPSAGNPNVYIGGISTASDDLNGVAQNLVDSLISQFGAGNVSATHSGNSLNVNINVQAQEGTEVQRRLATARRFISHAEHLLQHIMQPGSTAPPQVCQHYHHNNDGIGDAPVQAESNAREPSDDQSNPPSEQQLENTPQSMSMIFSQILHFYQHLLPTLERYEYLLNHPNEVDHHQNSNDITLPDQMAEIFHDMSHAFHALSDLSFNFLSPDPQTLMCYPQISPVRFPPTPLPQSQVRMSSPANSSSVSANSNISTDAQSISQGVSGIAPVNPTGQRTPVAVAAISTVVHIPASTFSNLMRSNPQRWTPTVSSAPITSTSASTSNTTTSAAPTPESIFQSLYNGGSFGPPTQSFQVSSSSGPFQSEMGVQNPYQMNMGQDSVSVQGESIESNASMNLGLQNIMQNIMQNISGTMTSVPTATTSNNTSTTSSSGVNNHPSSRHSHGHHQHYHHRQGADGTDSHSNQRFYRPHPHHHHHHQDGSVIHPDSLLPCGSFHFGPTFHQSGQQQGNSRPHVVEVSGIVLDQGDLLSARNATSASTQGASTTTTPSTTSVNADMSGISNILNGIFGSIPNMSGNVQVSSQPNSSANEGNPDNMEVDGDPQNNRNMVQMISQMFQSFLPGISTGSSIPAANPVLDSTNSQPSPTLREFIQQNLGLFESGEDTFLSDFLDVIADNMTMADLVGLFFQSSTQPLNNLREPLRKLIEKHYNNGKPLKGDDISDVSSKMADAISEIIAGVEKDITIRPDVDLNATLRVVSQEHMRNLINLLLNDDASIFGANLHYWYIEYAAWVFAVSDFAVTGGAERLTDALMESSFMLPMVQEMAPQLRQIAMQCLSSRLRTAIMSHPIPQARVERLLVKPEAKFTSRENPCKDAENGRAAKRIRKNEKVDVNRLWEEMNPETTNDSDPEGDSPPSPEDWHSLVPNDWVIIINRDSERQQQIGPQRPYSDAYISGLPAKRRKVMTQYGAEADHVDVKASLMQAIDKSGVQVKTDVETIEKDLDSSELQAMLETTFQHDIRQRLQSDEDYLPQQHPNSEEYFMKKYKGK